MKYTHDFSLQLCLQGWLSLRCGRGPHRSMRAFPQDWAYRLSISPGNVHIYVSIYYVSILSRQKLLSFPKLNHDLVVFVQGTSALCIPFGGSSISNYMTTWGSELKRPTGLRFLQMLLGCEYSNVQKDVPEPLVLEHDCHGQSLHRLPPANF